MKYFLVITILAFATIVTKSMTDSMCFEETDEEICESIHVQCGFKIHTEDQCGNKKDVVCACPVSESCSLKTFTCN